MTFKQLVRFRGSYFLVFLDGGISRLSANDGMKLVRYVLDGGGRSQTSLSSDGRGVRPRGTRSDEYGGALRLDATVCRGARRCCVARRMWDEYLLHLRR